MQQIVVPIELRLQLLIELAILVLSLFVYNHTKHRIIYNVLCNKCFKFIANKTFIPRLFQ
jgi:hypothetical protein